MVAAVGNRGKVVEKATPPKRGKLDEVNTQHNSVRVNFHWHPVKSTVAQICAQSEHRYGKMAALKVLHRSLSVELNFVNQPICASLCGGLCNMM